MISNLCSTFHNVRNAVEAARLQSHLKQSVTLIAVSKTKPAQIIQEIYEQNHRDFGENYVEECVQKAAQLPDDIRWHFIGHLQSNKVPTLLKIPNLYMIQSVDSEKLAQKINDRCKMDKRIMNVLLQVNLSQETTKSGSNVEEVLQLVQKVVNEFKNLRFRGFMTIGEEGDTEVFKKLFSIRGDICKKLNLNEEECELSMGMSGDFEQAILNGSTIVRIGSSIFGARDYTQKQKQQEQ